MKLYTGRFCDECDKFPKETIVFDLQSKYGYNAEFCKDCLTKALALLWTTTSNPPTSQADGTSQSTAASSNDPTSSPPQTAES